MSKRAHDIANDPDYGDMGRAIREARERARLSSSQLAERVGVPRNAMALIEGGERRVDIVELVRIAGALGCDALALFKSATSTARERHGDGETALQRVRERQQALA